MNSTVGSIAKNLRIFGVISISIVLSSWSQAQIDPHPSPIVGTVDATQAKEPISKYMYGMFIEHIGNLINHSLWSEMLDDRKFYFAIDSKPEAQTAGAPNAIRQRMQYKKWRPVGPDDFVTMDATHAFVGEHSPKIKLEAATPHGIQQSGLAVRRAKSYVGRVYLTGTPRARVKLSLVWGAGSQDRQEITIPTLHSEFVKFPLKFTARADSDEARLEIAGTGTGSFHIGTISPCPQTICMDSALTPSPFCANLIPVSGDSPAAISFRIMIGT
jgi:alpha-L-arabinofuranosidase